MLQGDISKLPERGHFYFAPTATWALSDPVGDLKNANKNVAKCRENSTNAYKSVGDATFKLNEFNLNKSEAEAPAKAQSAQDDNSISLSQVSVLPIVDKSQADLDTKDQEKPAVSPQPESNHVSEKPEQTIEEFFNAELAKMSANLTQAHTDSEKAKRDKSANYKVLADASGSPVHISNDFDETYDSAASNLVKIADKVANIKTEYELAQLGGMNTNAVTYIEKNLREANNALAILNGTKAQLNRDLSANNTESATKEGKTALNNTQSELDAANVSIRDSESRVALLEELLKTAQQTADQDVSQSMGNENKFVVPARQMTAPVDTHSNVGGHILAAAMASTHQTKTVPVVEELKAAQQQASGAPENPPAKNNDQLSMFKDTLEFKGGSGNAPAQDASSVAQQQAGSVNFKNVKLDKDYIIQSKADFGAGHVGILQQDHTGKVTNVSTGNLTDDQKTLVARKQAQMLMNSFDPNKGDIVINGKNPEMVNKVYEAMRLLKQSDERLKDVNIQVRIDGKDVTPPKGTNEMITEKSPMSHPVDSTTADYLQTQLLTDGSDEEKNQEVNVENKEKDQEVSVENRENNQEVSMENIGEDSKKGDKEQEGTGSRMSP